MPGPVNWSIPAASPTANDADAFAEKILAQEDKLMEAMTAKQFDETEARNTPPPAQPAEPTPFDPDADRAEFEQLLALIAQHKDEDTAVRHMSVDEFMTGLEEPVVRAATDTEE